MTDRVLADDAATMDFVSEQPDPANIEAPAGSTDEQPAFGSDLVVSALRRLGYRYLPMNPGSSWRGLHDSVVNYGANRDPQLLLCLHEEIAVSLAHGYAKGSGLPAAAAVHDLVGLMHASMAVYNAACDQVPLLLLGGSGPADPTKRRPVDWIHTASTQGDLVRDYVKWDAEAIVPEVFTSTIERAHAISRSGPPGPTYVSLDADAQEVALPDGWSELASASAAHTDVRYPDPAVVGQFASVLAQARSVTVVAGRQVRDPVMTSLLIRLVEALGAAYQDERNTVCFPTFHQQNCTGDRSAIGSSDVVLCIGVGDIPGLLAGHANTHRPTVLEISYGDLGLRSWSQERGHHPISDLRLVSDLIPGTSALLTEVRSRIEPAQAAGRAAPVRERVTALHTKQQQSIAARWDDEVISPTRLVGEVWNAVRDIDWMLVLRNTRSFPEGLWEFNGVGDFLGHSVGAGVGYGPGAMVGGSLAARDVGRLGVGIIGDGDFLMAAGALWTAVHYRIPMLMVVNDNSSFYNDEEHQAEVARHRGRPVENAWIGMRMASPRIDIGALARSYGAYATETVADPARLAVNLAVARDVALAGGAAVVHVHTSPT
jgi:acetolactate synthase-1/2/3 large subunit